MAYPDHLLARGEQIMLHKHPTMKVLAFPILWFIVIIGGGFALAALLRNDSNHTWWWIIIAAVGVILLFILCVVPFVKWRSEHFVITTRHVFFRTGFFQRREHQIPLGRIQNLETNVSFWGRIFGYGDLTVESAADQPLAFYNVAAITKVQGLLNQLIDDDRGRGDGLSDSGRYNRSAPDDRADEGAGEGAGERVGDRTEERVDEFVDDREPPRRRNRPEY